MPAWRVPAGALLLFVALALLLFSSAWIHPSAAWIGDDRDPHLFIWYLGWTPHQLSRLENPLFTTHLAYPEGSNLMWNTAVLAPAIVLWPVTAAFGPVVSYNVMATAALALSAWCAFLALRRFLHHDLAAALGGYLYGFSPYMVAQSMRHPHVTLAMFPPLALLLLHEIAVERRHNPLLIGALLGTASAVQLLTGEEILVTTMLVAALGVVLLAVLHPSEIVGRLSRTAMALGAAAASFLVLAGYPLVFQLFGPQRVSGLLQPKNKYVSDLLGFVVPPTPMALSTQATHAITDAFTGNLTENGAYLGLPLLILLIVAAVRGWERPVVRWATLLTVAIAVLSLGPRLHVGGYPTAIPLPWALIGDVPLAENILPDRLMLFAYLGVALVAGHLLVTALREGHSRAGMAAAAIALVPLVPLLPYPATAASAPAFFQPGGDAAHLHLSSVILVTPFAGHLSSDAMYWQAVAGYGFRMPEGEVFVPGPSLGPRPSPLEDTLTALNRGEEPPEVSTDSARMLEELRALGVTDVVVGPSYGHDRIVTYLSALLGRAPVRSGDVDVWWDVRGSISQAAIARNATALTA
jgi:hypothetical protein